LGPKTPTWGETPRRYDTPCAEIGAKSDRNLVAL